MLKFTVQSFKFGLGLTFSMIPRSDSETFDKYRSWCYLYIIHPKLIALYKLAEREAEKLHGTEIKCGLEGKLESAPA